MHEINFFGLLISPLLVFFLIAWAIFTPLAWGLERAGFFKFVYNREIAEISILIILLGIIFFIAQTGIF